MLYQLSWTLETKVNYLQFLQVFFLFLFLLLIFIFTVETSNVLKAIRAASSSEEDSIMK